MLEILHFYNTIDLSIHRKYSPMGYRLTYSLVKNRADADDIPQEVFIKYINKRPCFENAEHEKAWFMII